MTRPPALDVQGLNVTYPGHAWAVRDVSLQIEPGEVLAIVGESGSGKTTIARAVVGLLGPDTKISGSIVVQGNELVGATARLRQNQRGLVVGYVAQDPYSACNPLHRVGRHVQESWRAHRIRPPKGEIDRSLAALGIANAHQTALQHPHEWSGGMLQRATIAAANAHRPPLIVADEPTTALDSELADRVLGDLRSTGAAILLISHSLSTVRVHASHVAVCYAGRIVEHGATVDLLEAPRHPYTRALLAATPRRGHGLPVAIAGTPPGPTHLPQGCSFAARCPEAIDSCHVQHVAMRAGVACLRR